MREPGRMDGVLLGCVLLLCLGGLLMVYSSSAILARSANLPETTYLRSQAEKLAVGLVLLFLFARMPYRVLYGRAAWWGLGLAVLALLVVLLPLGLTTMVRGTRRFLNLRIVTLQPAEFARLSLILFLAYYCSLKEEWIKKDWRSLVVPLAAIGLLAGLIWRQPNLSSAALMGGLGFSLLYLAGHPLKRLLPILLPMGVVAAFTLKGYQLLRFIQFKEVLGGGHASLPYQVKQSLIALGSGGLLGKGIGQGLQKYHYLPFPHTDFILGIVGEEKGLVGVLVLFVFYAVVLARGLRIARTAPDRFSELLALGVTLSIGMNFFLHSMVAFGLGPVTGVPLPFVSHGGSSLLANLAAMGILLSISRHGRVEPAKAPPVWQPASGLMRAK